MFCDKTTNSYSYSHRGCEIPGFGTPSQRDLAIFWSPLWWGTEVLLAPPYLFVSREWDVCIQSSPYFSFHYCLSSVVSLNSVKRPILYRSCPSVRKNPENLLEGKYTQWQKLFYLDSKITHSYLPFKSNIDKIKVNLCTKRCRHIHGSNKK